MKSTDLDIARFPPLTPALLLESIKLQVRRDEIGMHECRDREVGPVRRKLGLIPLLPPDPNDSIAVAKDQLRALLAGLCDECPFDTCKMKGWGFIEPPSAAKRVGGGASVRSAR